MLPFEFTIDGPPVSQHARRTERVRQWIREVQAAARQRWPSADLPSTRPISLTIIYLFDSVSADVDNIIKPIADALKNLVYVDDEQLTDVICRKRNLDGDIRLENPSRLLTERLTYGDEFLYVLVEESLPQGLIF